MVSEVLDIHSWLWIGVNFWWLGAMIHGPHGSPPTPSCLFSQSLVKVRIDSRGWFGLFREQLVIETGLCSYLSGSFVVSLSLCLRDTNLV